MSDESGWYSRGYLPHIDADGLTQFVSWHTADSIPAAVLNSWREELAKTADAERWKELAQRSAKYCDEGHGECLLRDPRAAREVQECLFHDHMIRYVLHSWVIMPNHVHVLLTPVPGMKLRTIMKTLKTASAHAVNKVFGRKGQFWQEDFYDRFIRGEDHFNGCIRYIEWNPVKAKLTTDPKKWAFSSASSNARGRLEFLERERKGD